MELSHKSKLWEKILAKNGSNVGLSNFREIGKINSRLAAWAPKENSLRWHRSFLLLAARNLTQGQITLYQNFGNVSQGNPVSAIHFRSDTKTSLELNIDYLITLSEVSFLQENFTSEKFPRTLLEVGAGFGRTCHGLLKTFSGIQKYYIIDFPEMLELSSTYLRDVLNPHLFAKISFIDVKDIDKIYDSFNFDLGIQIDAFQEMNDEVIDFYLSKLFANAQFCFFPTL